MAIISTNLYSVPPKGLHYFEGGWHGGYGGESQVYALVKALNKLGVETEVFATPGSKPPDMGVLHYLPQGDWFTIWEMEQKTVDLYRKELFDCDVWHDWSLSKANHAYAYHGFGKKAIMTPWGTFAPPSFARYNTVLWSKFHRGLFLNQGYPQTTKYVWGGVDIEMYQPNYEPGDYFLYLSRMHPTKRPALIANLARKMGFKLIMACDSESPDHVTFLQELEGVIRGWENVKVILDPTMEQKVNLYQHAKGFFLASFQECFGLVVVEALACGTPVIVTDDGAYPEIVENGVTGFLCSKDFHFQEAVKNIENIDRRTCRKVVEERFNSDRVAREYIDIYKMVGKGDTF